jgi:hypothetical protein
MLQRQGKKVVSELSLGMDSDRLGGQGEESYGQQEPAPGVPKPQKH